MFQNRSKRTDDQRLPWFNQEIVAFVIGVVCGGVVIPFGSYLIQGDLDPIGHGRPIFLQLSAFLSTLIIALGFRCTVGSALGIYAGLVGLMFASGGSEYPLPSVVGLAVHGLLPAVLGFAFALGSRNWILSSVPRTRQ